jgi:ATP-dependent DNA helicase Rep
MFKLNPAQLEAVRHLDGPLLVLAGAGSGKTRVITQKIAWLVEDYGVKPSQIAAITFTNKAAKEMKERVGKLIRGRAEGLIVSTFHALGVRILRQEAGAGPQAALLHPRCGRHARRSTRNWPATVDKARCAPAIAHLLWKNAVIEPEAALADAADDIETAAAQLYADYERTLRAYQAVDFDDLIRLPVKLFERAPDVAERWQHRCATCWSTNTRTPTAASTACCELLTGARAVHRGGRRRPGDLRLARRRRREPAPAAATDYPALKVVKLEQNYRSTARILEAANALIANNEKLFDKRCGPSTARATQIQVPVLPRQRARGRAGGDEASDRRTASSTAPSLPTTPSSTAATTRRASSSSSCATRRLPTSYPAASPSSTRPRSRTSPPTCACSPTRTTIPPSSAPSPRRARHRRHHAGGARPRWPGAPPASCSPRPSTTGAGGRAQRQAARTGRARVRRLHQQAWKHAPPRAGGKVLEDILRAIGYEAWLFESLRAARGRRPSGPTCATSSTGWKKGEEENKTLLELTQTVALISMLDKDEQGGGDAGAARHPARRQGAGVPHVFLVGVEEGLLPHRDSLEPGKLEEERRLMYVGITRAQRSLTVSHCEKRKQGRELMAREPSRFIAEMGAEVAAAARRNTVPEPDAARAKASALRAMLAGKR